jgi:hypothetical protein
VALAPDAGRPAPAVMICPAADTAFSPGTMRAPRWPHG